MTLASSARCLAAASLVGALLLLPTVSADALADAAAPAEDTSCFLLPVRPGAAASEQWCVVAPRGTPLDALLLGAPPSIASSFSASSSIELGVDYQDYWLGGPTFTWYGSTTCTSSVNYVGDFTTSWKNIVSSAILHASSGCAWFWHYDGDGQTGDNTFCGVTNHKCDGSQMNSYLMNDRSNSVRFTYA